MAFARKRLDDDNFENGQLLRFATSLLNAADMERCVRLAQLPDFSGIAQIKARSKGMGAPQKSPPLRTAPC